MSEAFEPVFVGTSPAGVEWWARKPGDEAIMRRNLKAMWDRRNAKGVRRVELTPIQAHIVGDLADGREMTDLTVRATYVRGAGVDLDDLAALLDESEHADLAEAAATATTDAECDFAWVSAYASALILKAKLRGEPRVTLRRARSEARKARGL